MGEGKKGEERKKRWVKRNSSEGASRDDTANTWHRRYRGESTHLWREPLKNN